MNSVCRYEPYGWYASRRSPLVRCVFYFYSAADRVRIDCRQEEAVVPDMVCATFPRRFKWFVESPEPVVRLVMRRPPEKYRG